MKETRVIDVLVMMMVLVILSIVSIIVILFETNINMNKLEERVIKLKERTIKLESSKIEYKFSSYIIKGKKYIPMSRKEAISYKEFGIASWYGWETRNRKGGDRTANNERFNPRKLTAAHKRLPLPIYVKVTNLENNKSIIVRVNDRGPFIKGRIIDLSSGAAKKLGYYEKGVAKVFIQTVEK